MNLLLCLSILAAVVVIWCTVPALWVLCLPDVPIAHRRAAALCFGRASLRGLVMLPADLLAPLVVPFALLRTRWEDDELPRWARWWGNDVGINGDKFTWVMDPATGRSRAGWVLRHHNGAYQLHATRRLGPVCLRTNYGHKVDFTTWRRPVMPVVCIAISALSWKEPDPQPAS